MLNGLELLERLELFKPFKRFNIFNQFKISLRGYEPLDSLPLDYVLASCEGNPKRVGVIMPLPQSFKAMVVSETADKKFVREIKQRNLSELPEIGRASCRERVLAGV